MYYIIKSAINMDNLSDINHEIISITTDKNDAISKLNLYIKTNIPKSNKLINDKITYNENNFTISVQIHEYVDNSKDIFTEFVDDSEHNEEIIFSIYNIQEYFTKIDTIINESKKETLRITNKYNNVMNLYKHSNGVKSKGKSLVLKF